MAKNLLTPEEAMNKKPDRMGEMIISLTKKYSLKALVGAMKLPLTLPLDMLRLIPSNRLRKFLKGFRYAGSRGLVAINSRAIALSGSQSENLQIAALTKNIQAARQIDKLTDAAKKMIEQNLDKHPDLIELLDKPSPEAQRLVMTKDPKYVQLIKNRTLETEKLAVLADPMNVVLMGEVHKSTVELVRELSDEAFEYLVQNNLEKNVDYKSGEDIEAVIKDIRMDRTLDEMINGTAAANYLQLSAVMQRPQLAAYIPELSEEAQSWLIVNDPNNLQYFADAATVNIIDRGIDMDPHAIKHVAHKVNRMQFIRAIDRDWTVVEYADIAAGLSKADKLAIYRAAINKDPKAADLIKDLPDELRREVVVEQQKEEEVVQQVAQAEVEVEVEVEVEAEPKKDYLSQEEIEDLLKNQANEEDLETSGEVTQLESVSNKNELNSQLLHEVSMEGYFSVEESRKKVLELLDAGADINAADENGITAMHRAAMNGSVGMITLLASRGADLNPVTRYKTTPLSEAVQMSSVESVEELLKLGADIDLGKPLSKAVELGRVDIASILIKSGAKYEDIYLSSTGVIPRGEFIKLVAASGVDINRIGKFGSLLHGAARSGEVELIQVLISAGADIQAADAYGNTALHEAVSYGRLDALKMLIGLGADLNAQDRDGRTALHRAALENSVELARELVGAGADASIKNKSGKTANDIMPNQIFRPQTEQSAGTGVVDGATTVATTMLSLGTDPREVKRSVSKLFENHGNSAAFLADYVVSLVSQGKSPEEISAVVNGAISSLENSSRQRESIDREI